MPPFEVLADPVRRRILDLLLGGEQPASAIIEIVLAEFPISQPAVSKHLRVLRDSNFTAAAGVGAARRYTLVTGALREVDGWLARYRERWSTSTRSPADDSHTRRASRRSYPPNADL